MGKRERKLADIRRVIMGMFTSIHGYSSIAEFERQLTMKEKKDD